MNEKMEWIDITLSDGVARKLMALCAVTGEAPEEKIASILKETLEGEGKVAAVPNSREAPGAGGD